MGNYNSAREVAYKMDSEGGLAEFFFGYGFSDFDIPGDVPEEMKHKIISFLGQAEVYAEIQSYFYDQLEKAPVPGDFDYYEVDESREF